MIWTNGAMQELKSTSSTPVDSIILYTVKKEDDEIIIHSGRRIPPPVSPGCIPHPAPPPSPSSEERVNVSLQCPTFCYLYYAVVAALGSISFGATLVYSSPFLVDVARTSNFTQWEEAFESCAYQNILGPLTPIGAIFGSLLAPWCVSIFGLVVPIVVAGGVFASGWGLIASSWFVLDPHWFRAMVLTGRFVAGFGAGWLATVAPAYMAEISPSEQSRSRLAILFSEGLSIGIFLCYLVGYFIKYWQLAFIGLVFSVAHGLLALTLKESPVRTRNVVANIKSHCGTRKKSEDDDDDGALWKWCFNKKFVLLIFIASSLFSLQQLTGFSAIAFYTGPIFLSVGGETWTLPPGLVASIAIGIVAMLSNIGVFYFLDKLSRTLFIFFGAIGMMVGCLGLGAFFTIVRGVYQPIDDSNATASLCFFRLPTQTSSALGNQYSPLAILSIAVFVVSSVVGWSSPLYVYTAEIFPNKLRSFGFGIVLAFKWLSTALLTFLFPLAVQYLGPALTFYVLAGVNFLAAIFVFCLAPETKNREMGYHYTQDYSIVQNMKEFLHNFSCYNKCSHSTGVYYTT